MFGLPGPWECLDCDSALSVGLRGVWKSLGYGNAWSVGMLDVWEFLECVGSLKYLNYLRECLANVGILCV